ncbi:Hypothetical_protein [Hexamita inflata]|uniref:Hypothetical_protein n=1 Tax=Hexamita inflata TaxID=28002 RepID=A0AA86Q072_9EUKA|nr:Hypothetical protein HINF_LOCUS35037 [Hexamita inflata]
MQQHILIYHILNDCAVTCFKDHYFTFRKQNDILRVKISQLQNNIHLDSKSMVQQPRYYNIHQCDTSFILVISHKLTTIWFSSSDTQSVSRNVTLLRGYCLRRKDVFQDFVVLLKWDNCNLQFVRKFNQNEKCAARESDPDLLRGKQAFYHQTSGAYQIYLDYFC